MVIIKINAIPDGGPEALKSRAERAWKITPQKLHGQTTAIVMHKGIVLEQYKILSFQPDSQEPDRIAFELEVVPDSLFKNRKVDYRTVNPCTTAEKLTIYV